LLLRFLFPKGRCFRSPIFNNFSYTPDLHDVLRPQASIASLTLWSLFSEDHLAHGSPYDIGCVIPDEKMRPTGALTRRVLDANYREPHLLLLDGFSISLDSLAFGYDISTFIPLYPSDLSTCSKGATCEEAIRASQFGCPLFPNFYFLTLFHAGFETSLVGHFEDKESSLLNGWRRHVQRAVHKKETVKLLLRGMTHQSSNPRMRESIAGSSTGHHFVSQHVTAGDMCAVCHQNVPGVVVRMATADSKTLTMSVSRPYTNATHCGFLMKKGATFKMWKPRWFVLDASRHQLVLSISLLKDEIFEQDWRLFTDG
uniref:PH domain-containing protein n=1 Tax=Parascaris equorum TaxID=6256 RepID=A0A914RT17_PAREQ